MISEVLYLPFFSRMITYLRDKRLKLRSVFMLKQKISRIMSLLSAAVMMTALPVSAGAENIDVSKVDSTINVRVNKPYLNFVIKTAG